MNLPKLEESIMMELNTISPEETMWKENYPYWHAIAAYGITGMAHAYLMHQAKEGITRGRGAEEIFFKYGIHKECYCLEADLRNVEKDGIFIPRHAYAMWEKQRTVVLFDSDYRNVHARNKEGKFCFVAPPKTDELMTRKWVESDFGNPELVERGIQFGKDMWRICVNDYKQLLLKHEQSPQTTRLAEPLIVYYSEIVKNC